MTDVIFIQTVDIKLKAVIKNGKFCYILQYRNFAKFSKTRSNVPRPQCKCDMGVIS